MKIEVTRRISDEPEWISEVWNKVFNMCSNCSGAVEDENGRLRTHHAYVDAFLGHNEYSCSISLRAENNDREIGLFRFDRNTSKEVWGFFDKFGNKLILH